MKKRDDDNGRYYPPANKAWTNPQWGPASALKGETSELVDHCAKIFSESNNTSVDSAWWVHRNWNLADAYTVLVLVLFLVPTMAIFWIPLFLCLFPPVLLNRLYIGCLVPQPCHAIHRDNWRFKIHCGMQFVLSIPASILVVVILLSSSAAMFVFGMLYLIPTSLLGGRWPTQRLLHNRNVLKPYQGGPSLLWHFPDIVVAVMGSVHRQHFLEFLFSFTNMFLVNPWMKYWVTGNMYLCDLGERFLTQIGPSMRDMDIESIDTHGMNAISRAKNSGPNREEIDLKTFSPHYPYPPNHRRYAIGMQHGSVTTTWVHTTHYRSNEVDMEGPIASLSHSALLPMYRVVLWRNNPFHIFTGYVEANISSGMPTEPEKYLGMEHPMWLINSRNKLAADRNFRYSLGSIDGFFDDFIPQFQHYIRLQVRGRKVADAYLEKEREMGRRDESFNYQTMAEV